MIPATVTFHKVIQDSQDLASVDPSDEHMLSQVFFTLEVGGEVYSDMSVVIRQPFGTNYATETIEAEPPKGSYKGNWNHEAFKDAVEDYYRGLIGSQARGLNLGPGVKNFRMRNNTLKATKTYKFEIPED